MRRVNGGISSSEELQNIAHSLRKIPA